MRVRLHWAERFINWFPFNTKLYLRGTKGADHAKADELHKELFDALVPFMDELKASVRKEMPEEKRAIVRALKRTLSHMIRNTPHSCQTEEHCCALHAAHNMAAEKVEEHLDWVLTKIDEGSL